MTSLTDRQSFREAVAAVAEKARAALPQNVNGRLEAATKLVLMHDVMPQADGSILVGSSTDAMKSYLLTGQSCECQDFVHGKAPDGWCQHRIAAGIHKRVSQLLPTDLGSTESAQEMVPQSTPKVVETERVPQPLPEAAASVNVRFQIAGREVQWTLRDHDEARLATRLEALLARYPLPQPTPQAASQPQGQGKEWCSKHGVQMKQTTKEGRSWWSHKTADGWCKGK